VSSRRRFPSRFSAILFTISHILAALFVTAAARAEVQAVDVPAASRVTVGLAGAESVVPELVNESFGTLIESTRPIIAERSLQRRERRHVGRGDECHGGGAA
jgi:hypothetical protein